MTCSRNLATLRRCQEHYDNLAPPDPDEIPDGCNEDDYDDDELDESY